MTKTIESESTNSSLGTRKKSRKQCRSKLRKRMLKSNKYENEQNVTNLPNLPLELLEKIIENIPLWHRNRIRSACRVLRYATDSLTLHEYKSSMNSCQDKESYGYVSLKTIEQATWPYVQIGHSTMFLGKILSMTRNQYEDPFPPTIKNIKAYLKDFYALVDELDDSESQKSRLLFLITLLGFLKELKNCTEISSIDMQPNHWRLVYQLKGSFIGIISFHSKIFTYAEDSRDFLVLLSMLMLSTNAGLSFRKSYVGKDVVYVLGHDLKQRARLPKVSFSFDIIGSKKILDFLKTTPTNGTLKELPCDEFSVNIRVDCNEAIKFGCLSSYVMNVGPKPHE